MDILVSLIIGAGLGGLICYAVDLPCSTARIVAVCMLGGLVGGILTWLLTPAAPLIVAAIVALITAFLAYYLHARGTLMQNEFRHDA